jgi:hypothetical protein
MKNGNPIEAPQLLSEAEQDAVRSQLARIVASSLFRHSKRFPDFLRYTVEQALSGDTEDIKERTLGIEVFGRDPGYDTNLDPVVRMTAVEVRKRLAQYYQQPGRENDVRIDFSRGSYIPEFRFPKDAALPAPSPAVVVQLDTANKPDMRRWYFVAGLAMGILLTVLVWRTIPARQNALDRFWGPVVNSPSPVLLCIPDLSPTLALATPVDAKDPVSIAMASLPAWFRLDRVSFSDTLTLSMLTGVIGHNGHAFRVRRSSDAKLEDLEEGPVVLIGGLSNEWTRRLGSGMRFTPAAENGTHYVSDHENPSARQWGVFAPRNEPVTNVTKDYAIISRVFDSTTGHFLVTAAGLLPFGTEAAGECLSDADCLAQGETLAPGDWKHKNIQVVIETAIIGGNHGKPHVISAYLW